MGAEGRTYWIRLAKSAAFLALGAAAHAWLLPLAGPTPARDELVPVAEPAGFVPQPARPHGQSVIALLENTSDSLAVGVPRSQLAPGPAPVGTSGRVMIAVENVTARSILDNRGTQARSDLQVAAAGAADTDATFGAVGTEGTARAPESIGTSGTARTESTQGTLGSLATLDSVIASAPTAELQLASDALSPWRRSLHDELALAKPSVTPDAPHIAVNARQLMDDEQMVRRVLQEYRTAYEQLDAAAAKSVWPTVDERALTHAFQQLASQRLTFRSCGISITGTGANARCRGEAEYLPKIGAKRAYTTSGEWVFDLAREQTSWRIINASVQ